MDIADAFLVKVMLASLEPETLLAWCVLVLRHGTMGRLWCGVAPALGVTVAVRLVSVLRHAQRTRSQANFTSKVFLVCLWRAVAAPAGEGEVRVEASCWAWTGFNSASWSRISRRSASVSHAGLVAP